MSFFPQASNFIVQGGTFTAQTSPTTISTAASTLQLFLSNTAIGALHDSAERFDAPRCHPDTRKAVIQRIMDWLDDDERSSYFMWIYGPAGAGKSAIAQSIADFCYEMRKLAGCFFFGRTSARRNTKDFLIPTIAYQMMTHLPEIRERVPRAIERDPAIFSRSLEAQIQTLIVQPVNEAAQDVEEGVSLRSHSVSLVIVDGLDECDSAESQGHILRTLSQLVAQLSIRLSILVASRPEQAIRSAFRDEPLSSFTSVINLDDFSSEVHKDIELFLDSKFQSIKHKHPARFSFPLAWPTAIEMDRLIDRTNGHFIYASTVMRYLESNQASPVQRLAHILEQNIPTSDKPFAALDALYHHILSGVGDVENLLRVLAVVLLAHSTKMTTVKFIEELHSFQPGTIHIMPNDLHSVIYVPEDRVEGLRIYHTSFSDFLFDRARSASCFMDQGSSRLMIAKAIIARNFVVGGMSIVYVKNSSFEGVLTATFNDFPDNDMRSMMGIFLHQYGCMDTQSRVKVHEDLTSSDIAQLFSSCASLDTWSMMALADFLLWLDGKAILGQSQDLFTFHLNSIVIGLSLSLIPNLPLVLLVDTNTSDNEKLQYIISTVSSLQLQQLDVDEDEAEKAQLVKKCCISVLELISMFW